MSATQPPAIRKKTPRGREITPRPLNLRAEGPFRETTKAGGCLCKTTQKAPSPPSLPRRRGSPQPPTRSTAGALLPSQIDDHGGVRRRLPFLLADEQLPGCPTGAAIDAAARAARRRFHAPPAPLRRCKTGGAAPIGHPAATRAARAPTRVPERRAATLACSTPPRQSSRQSSPIDDVIVTSSRAWAEQLAC